MNKRYIFLGISLMLATIFNIIGNISNTYIGLIFLGIGIGMFTETYISSKEAEE